MRSGFAAILGRPNVGKSSLVNALVGTKVSIISDKPNTTRSPLRGILDLDDAQVVLVDTPGLHKPRTALGHRLNQAASASAAGVDVGLVVLDAAAGVGRGDAVVAAAAPPGSLAVLNKVDLVGPERLAAQIEAASELGLDGCLAVSALTGQGLGELVDQVVARLPEGPRYYPPGTVSDVPEALWVAELVREQLLAVVREELPHSIACRVTEWEWPRIRCEILVERPSQKAIVIGRGGEVLKNVGMAVRQQLPPGAYLELFVKVEKDWQRRPAALRRLGL